MEARRPEAAGEPTDPDIDLSAPVPESESVAARRSGRPRGGQGLITAAVAVGGGIGAAARYGASLLWPVAAHDFPWPTLAVNALGCAVIGVFMVLITHVWAAHRLVRPFFGTGVLGGFTTFSTYAVDIERLVSGGHARTALAYLALTLLAALAAVGSAAWTTRRLVTWRRSS
ncbi:fluoride efflux transporter CrcB [Streptomyces alboniger]|uniref:Fluoride-specific ion channel FluC n=1 Tax=Streptomyces alboniger TaxID=132473 RepID=A0A5J6HY94_STRAD|nr:fluoride efflux transporter CrcB [Streptomyces alboniger]QEV21575.1 fluoride efflux transporter CrcB [Streptomyces alboniger]